MRRFLKPVLIALPVVVILAVAGAYVHDEVVASDHVSRGVHAAGHDLSRLSEADAVQVVAGHEADLLASPVALVVGEATVELDPADVSLAIDEADVVSRAMRLRRQAGFPAAFTAWLGTWFSDEEVPVPVAVDTEALAEQLARWSTELIDHPAYEGAVVLNSTTPEPEYPRTGTRIDIDATVPLIVESLAMAERTPVVVPLTDLDPVVTDAQVDAAVEVARRMVERTVRLEAAEGDHEGALVFTPVQLAAALRSEVVDPPDVRVSFDPDRIAEFVAEQLDDFVVDPVDATFEFDRDTKTLSVVPSQMGRVVDLDGLADAVERVALGSGTGPVPMRDGARPLFSTEDAEAMGELSEMSSFTTYHACCESRVVNIQLIADTVRGAIVMPGETFSINDHVGQRTRAKGYVPAGAIIGGEVVCCDSPINIGGGTSQFATTFYNAVYFGCYEDVTHTPHSLYFSRYPYIREATLGFPYPDVAFRNDSDAIVYIDTSYTGSSITVTFYGNNGGRECESSTSGNVNTRIMTLADGSVTTQTWTWRYSEPKPPSTTTTVASTTTEGTDTTATTVASTTTQPETTTTAAPPETTTTAPPPPPDDDA